MNGICFVPEHFDFPPVVHGWAIKDLGMYNRVCATGHIKDPMPFIEKSGVSSRGGSLSSYFSHQEIIISDVNNLVTGLFPPGHFPPPPGLPPPDISPPDISPLGHYPPRTFPPSHFPLGHFPPRTFPPPRSVHLGLPGVCNIKSVRGLQQGPLTDLMA